LYADQKRFNLVPVFLEQFCDSEELYLERKGFWRCDRDLSSFDTWESKKDMIDRLACSRQGVPALLDTNDFMCDHCRESRDMVCPECTKWERACATQSGAKLKESVETLARYLVKENQLAGRGDAAVASMTARVGKASCVIVLCSRAYKLSPSFRAESLHASSENKRVICLKCEEWESDGWLKNFMTDKPTVDYRSEGQLDEVFATLQEALGPPPETLSLTRTKSALSRSRSRSISMDGSSESSSKLHRVRSVTNAAVRFSRQSGNGSSKEDSGSQSSGSALAEDTAKEKAEPFAIRKSQSAGADLSRILSRASTKPSAGSSGSSDSARKKGGLSVPSSPAVRPHTPVSPAMSALSSLRAPPSTSSKPTSLAFALDDDEADMGGPNMSTISRTQSIVSMHEHIELVHRSVNATKDAELADLRAQHKAEQDRQAHNLALLQAEQRLVEIHRLEKEAIVRAAELRENRVIAMAACVVAVVVAVACRKSF
jgi:hypothetical protein